MKEKLKILQLSPQFPFPDDDGGKISIANELRQFSLQGAEVTFFAFHKSLPKANLKSIAETYGKIVIYEHSTKNTISKILKYTILDQSIYLSKHYSDKIHDFLAKQVESDTPDVIHVDHSAMMPLAMKLRTDFNIPVGLRMQNVEWMIWQRYADFLPAWHPKRWFIARQAKLLKDAEIEFFSKMDIGFAITPNDRDVALRDAPQANIIAAGPGVDEKKFNPSPEITRNPYEMVIATIYSWVHNVDGVIWFIKNVMPRIREKFPEATLRLIGKNAPDSLANFKDMGVELVGYVDSVTPHLNKASVYIAPLFVGSGIRIKILEAMAMELPVVATSISAEGIKTAENNGLIITDNAEEQASAIIDMFTNQDKARELGKSARQFVLKEYSWHNNVKKMLDSYRSLVENK